MNYVPYGTNIDWNHVFTPHYDSWVKTQQKKKVKLIDSLNSANQDKIQK